MNHEPSPSTGEDISDLEAHLGYWLRRVSNHVSGAFARALQARQVSVAEWVALRYIHMRQREQSHQGITPRELADAMGMTRGAISKVLNKLERKDWVARSVNPEDNRVQWLSLTPQGERVLPELAQIADSNDDKFFGCLNADEQASLREALQKLTRIHEWSDTPID